MKNLKINKANNRDYNVIGKFTGHRYYTAPRKNCLRWLKSNDAKSAGHEEYAQWIQFVKCVGVGYIDNSRIPEAM